MNGLWTEGVVFDYPGQRRALRNVSLAVRPAEMTALVGPNGCGKSTLLRHLAGLLVPRQGRVLLDGRDLCRCARRDAARCIAYVPQRCAFLFSLPVFDAVLLGRRPYVAWRPSPRDVEAVRRVIRALDMTALEDRPVTELSGGELQKVVIARALAQDTPYLLLDEPTSQLDVAHQIEIMEYLIRAARRDGKGVLVAAHDLNLAGRYADRVAMMCRGELAAVGTPDDVLSPANLRAVYGVEATVFRDGDRPHVICRTRTLESASAPSADRNSENFDGTPPR